MVSGEAATLEQVARYYSFSAGTNAAVIKAIIMASASKNPLTSWSHTSTAPLDPQNGAGQINFNWAYQVMTAGPQTAGTTSLVASTGWSYSTVNPSNTSGSTQTYYFNVPSGQPYDLSALLTWERMITVGTNSSPYTFTPSMGTIDLNLYQANGNFTLGTLLQSSRLVHRQRPIRLRPRPAGWRICLAGYAGRFALRRQSWEFRLGLADPSRAAVVGHRQWKLE